MLTNIRYVDCDQDLKDRIDAASDNDFTNSSSFTIDKDQNDKTLASSELVFTNDAAAGRIRWNHTTGKLEHTNDNSTFLSFPNFHTLLNGTAILFNTPSPGTLEISVDTTSLLPDTHNTESAVTVHGGLVNKFLILDVTDTPKYPDELKGTIKLKETSGTTITLTPNSTTDFTVEFNSAGVSSLKAENEIVALQGDVILRDNPLAGIRTLHSSSDTIDLIAENIDTNTSGAPITGIVDLVDSPTIEVKRLGNAVSFDLVATSVGIEGRLQRSTGVDLTILGPVTIYSNMSSNRAVITKVIFYYDLLDTLTTVGEVSFESGTAAEIFAPQREFTGFDSITKSYILQGQFASALVDAGDTLDMDIAVPWNATDALVTIDVYGYEI